MSKFKTTVDDEQEYYYHGEYLIRRCIGESLFYIYKNGIVLMGKPVEHGDSTAWAFSIVEAVAFINNRSRR